MSDDLVKQLRAKNAYCAPDFSTPIADPVKLKAADRIEELEANALANRVAIMRLEAKLAKAVEALQGLVPILCEGFEDGCGKLSRHDCAACEGYATLAELKC